MKLAAVTASRRASRDATTGTMIALRDVTKSHPGGVRALRGVSLDIATGDFLAIVGASGSGKSTLLNLMGALDRPTTGEVVIDGWPVAGLKDDEVSTLRARSIGFVFQQFHLAPNVRAIDNVADGLLYSGVARAERLARARAALVRVGLEPRLDHRPHELSGGERQRVAIARAVVGQPPLLLADEPTGSLDTRSGAEVMEVLGGLNADGTTVVVITHDESIAAALPARIRLRDGLVVTEAAHG